MIATFCFTDDLQSYYHLSSTYFLQNHQFYKQIACIVIGHDDTAEPSGAYSFYGEFWKYSLEHSTL